jgi:hypothetical protein
MLTFVSMADHCGKLSIRTVRDGLSRDMPVEQGAPMRRCERGTQRGAACNAWQYRTRALIDSPPLDGKLPRPRTRCVKSAPRTHLSMRHRWPRGPIPTRALRFDPAVTRQPSGIEI